MRSNRLVLLFLPMIATIGYGEKVRDICESDMCACSEKPKGIHHVTCKCPFHKKDSFIDVNAFPTTTLNLTITDCNRLALAGSFKQLSILRSFTVKNIEDLRVDKDAFFKGHSRMISLTMENVTLGAIPTGAFEGLNSIHSLTMKMVRIGKIESGAFARLHHVNYFEWSDSHVDHIATGAFGYGESNVTNLHIRDCTITHFASEAMIFNNVGNFELTETEIAEDIPGSGIAIAVMRNISITNNRILGRIRGRAFSGTFSETAKITGNKVSRTVEPGAFYGLRPQFEPRSFKLPRVEFNDNVFAEVRNGSLAFQMPDTPARFTASNNTFLACNCEDFVWLVKQGDNGNQFYQQLVTTAKCLRPTGPIVPTANLRATVVKQYEANENCKGSAGAAVDTDAPHAFPEVRRPPNKTAASNPGKIKPMTELPAHFTIHTTTTTTKPTNWKKPQQTEPEWYQQRPTTLGALLYVEGPTKSPNTTQIPPPDPTGHTSTLSFNSNTFQDRIGLPPTEDGVSDFQEMDDNGHVDRLQVAKCGGLCDCFEKGGAFEVLCTCHNRHVKSMLILPRYLPRNTGNLTIAKCAEVTIRDTFRLFMTLRQVTITEVGSLLVNPFSFLYKSSNLHQVIISHTGIPELPIGSFSHASYVHILGFHDVQIQKIRRDAFGSLTNVNYVYFEESVVHQVEMSAFGNYSSSISYLRFANSTLGLDPAALKLRRVEDLVIDRCSFPSGIPPGGISAQTATNFHLLRSSVALLQPHALAINYNETAAVEANIFRGLIATNAFRSLTPNVRADSQHLIVANNVFLRAEEGGLDLVLTEKQNLVIVNNTLAICHCGWFQRYVKGDSQTGFLGQMLRTGRCVTREDVYLQPSKITDPNFECGAVF